MVLGMFGYVVNDAFIKLAAEDLPLFQAIFVRGVFLIALIALIAGSRGELRGAFQHFDRALGLRVLMETVGTALYLSALTRAPLAGLTAVLQIVPLIVTFVAARLLRESLSLHRVLSVVVGFLGVLLIVRPGSSDFNPWFLVGFVVVGAIVVREIATKNISREIPSLVVSLTTGVTITTMGFVGAFVQGWQRLETSDVVLLGAASVFLTVGYVSSVITVRVGDITFSAPFRYSVLVFAIALQIVVFDEVPDALTFVGAAIVAAAGIWAFRHEQRLASIRTRPNAPT